MNDSTRADPRTRNLIAVSVLWSGLTASWPQHRAGCRGGDARPSAVERRRRHARRRPTPAETLGLSLLTAAPAPVTGVAPDGTAFNGTFDLRRFQVRSRRPLRRRPPDRRARHRPRQPERVSCRSPGPATRAPAPAGEGLRQPVPTPGACDILTLGLGPLDLDLLGLRVALDEVNLLIEAIPGAGNLLGNLLCGVAGLLDGGLGGGLGGLLTNLLDAIADLLNGLLGR